MVFFTQQLESNYDNNSNRKILVGRKSRATNWSRSSPAVSSLRKINLVIRGRVPFALTAAATCYACCVSSLFHSPRGSRAGVSFFAEAAAFSSFHSWDYGAMTHTTSRGGDGTITVSPTDEEAQTATVVICHGLGDTAEGFADVAENLATQMPHVKFILPTAPTQPVTMNMGMSMPSWYDIVGLDERSNEKCTGIKRSEEIIRSLLDEEHKRGIPYNRMVLAGFSQGGALSLFTGLQLPSADQKLAGILVLSGYLAGAPSFSLTPGLEATPILHCHGTNDPLVLFQMAGKSRDLLVEKGVTDYTIKPYPIQHTVIPEEIKESLMFLMKVLPPTSNCYVKLKDPADMSVKELKEAIRRGGLGSKAVGLMEKQDFVKLVQEHREQQKRSREGK